MGISKKNIIFAVLMTGVLVLPIYKVFADKLDDCFCGGLGTCSETVTVGNGVGVEGFSWQQSRPVEIVYKYGFASTRYEENGVETYKGEHYLRCVKMGGLFYAAKEIDTGRHWYNNGIDCYLTTHKYKKVRAPAGGFKSFYGNKKR